MLALRLKFNAIIFRPRTYGFDLIFLTQKLANFNVSALVIHKYPLLGVVYKSKIRNNLTLVKR